MPDFIHILIETCERYNCGIIQIIHLSMGVYSHKPVHYMATIYILQLFVYPNPKSKHLIYRTLWYIMYRDLLFIFFGRLAGR